MDREYRVYPTEWNEESFREMMAEYGQDVWNYAYYLTRQSHAADDISQEVFMKVYTGLSAFQRKCTFKTWLLTITRHAAFNYRRSAFLRRAVTLDFFTDKEAARSAEQEALGRMNIDRIWRIVLQLSPKYREILILDAKYDLSTEEISMLLGIPPGTVKSRLSRARSKVQMQLKEEFEYGKA